MKVAHLTAHLSPESGGLLTAVQGLTRHLADTGTDIAVLGPAWRAGGLDAGWTGVATHPCRPRGPRRFGYAAGLGAALDRLGPDVVHVQGLWTHVSAVSRAWSRRRGRPHIVSPHGMLEGWALARSRWKKRLAGLLFEDAHLREAACLHALSAAEAAAMRGLGLRNPICLIPNGVELPETAPGPTDGHTILFLGRMHPKKGLPELLRGWAMAGDAIAGWRLRIVGWDEGGHAAELRRLADRKGGPLEIAPPVAGAAKDAAFRSASAFVLPSHSEGQPVAVLEAWAHGLPVLMTDACNLPEGFAAGAAIRMAPDPPSIASALAELVRMGESGRRAMGAAGRALVERDFAWADVARRMRDVYAWVLSRAPRPACVLD